MITNEGTIDRGVRTLLGLGLVALGTGIFGLLGAVILATGLVGWCPVYALLRLDSHLSAPARVRRSTSLHSSSEGRK